MTLPPQDPRAVPLARPHGVRWVPPAPTGTGALVLAGSSGRVDSDRAALLARHGVLAESVQWFGGEGQSPGPYDVPLETFGERVADLARECDRVVVVGTSFGAEAALLTGAHCRDVDAVAAFAPSDVVWAGVGEDGSVTSHWTIGGEPTRYVEFDDTWQPDDEPPAYVGLYEASRERYAEQVEQAGIPVERVADVLLVAGGDDRVWPSVAMAERIRARRERHGLDTVVVTAAAAGHRTVLPGEEPAAGGAVMQRGGSDDADRALGAAAWPHLAALLHPRRRTGE